MVVWCCTWHDAQEPGEQGLGFFLTRACVLLLRWSWGLIQIQNTLCLLCVETETPRLQAPSHLNLTVHSAVCGGHLATYTGMRVVYLIQGAL